MVTSNSVAASDAPRPGRAGHPDPFFATARDLVALTKPRVTTIVLVTGGAGMALAPGSIGWARLVLAMVGTVLVVSAANALNMWWERDVDGLMARTANRPLPAGRMGEKAALLFGVALGLVSVPMLFAVNALTGWLGLFALVSYVAVYTPLKRVTPRALEIGAVPGAIPPLLGWTAVTGRLDAGGLVLFALLLLWQIPHFIAISLFRAEDYARAGLKVHAVAHGEHTARVHIAVTTAILAALGVTPVFFGMAGWGYGALAALFGAAFAVVAFRGLSSAMNEPQRRLGWARQVFGYSIVYLLLILAALLVGNALL